MINKHPVAFDALFFFVLPVTVISIVVILMGGTSVILPLLSGILLIGGTIAGIVMLALLASR